MLSRADVITASAPAKVILFGEHAVVYGQPALAVPLSNLRVTVRRTPADEPLFYAGDMARRLPDGIAHADLTDPVLKMARATADFLGISVPAGRYEITSTIPPASGLGSGAALSAAVGRAVAAGHDLSDTDLNALVYEIERIHHGTPSGIDNTVIVFEQPVYFVRGTPPHPFRVGGSFRLIVADTGRSALTKESVGDVRVLTEEQPEFAHPRIEAIGQITAAAARAIADGDIRQTGELMNRNHALLRELTVSSPELETLVAAALAAGALGAKLSGGGRGGNMIALVTAQTESAVCSALQAAGAARITTTTVT